MKISSKTILCLDWNKLRKIFELFVRVEGTENNFSFNVRESFGEREGRTIGNETMASKLRRE
jgi:hypothetical protein